MAQRGGASCTVGDRAVENDGSIVVEARAECRWAAGGGGHVAVQGPCSAIRSAVLEDHSAAAAGKVDNAVGGGVVHAAGMLKRGAVVEVDGAVGHGGRRAQRAGTAADVGERVDVNRAGIDDGLAGVGVQAGERQGAGADLGQGERAGSARMVGDDTRVGAAGAIVIADGECLVRAGGVVDDGAAGAGEVARAEVVSVEVERAPGNRERAVDRAERTAPADLEGALVHDRSAAVVVSAGEREGASTALGQGARPGTDRAGNGQGARAHRVDDHFGGGRAELAVLDGGVVRTR